MALEDAAATAAEVTGGEDEDDDVEPNPPTGDSDDGREYDA